MRCSLNSTEELMEHSVRGLDGLISSLNKVGYDDKDMIEENNFQPRGQQTFIEMEFPVNYVSRCIRTVTYSHEDNSKLQILAKLLSAKYLHREIREKGGAYGSGAKIGGSVFSFFSYRDPNTLKTLDTFDGSVKWACNGSFTEVDIEEAKLSVFSAVDSPVAPANRGMILFQNGVTNEMRQRHRDGLFAVGKEDLIDVANRYLVMGKQIHSEAIIGPKNDTLLKDDNWIKPRKLQL